MKSAASKLNPPAGLLKAAEHSFLLYIFFLPFSLPFSFRLSGVQVQFVDAVFLVSLFFWILAIAARSAAIRATPLYLFVGLFVAAMSVSALLSTDPRKSLIKLLGVYYLAAVAIIAFNLCRQGELVGRAMIAFLLGAALTGIGTVVTVFGFYFDWESTRPMLSHYGSLPVGNYPRIRSLFENANMASNYLNVAVAAIVASVWNGRVKFTVGISAGLLAVISAILTVSPGIGGVILTLGLLYWVRLKTERPVAATLGLWISIVFAAAVLTSATLSLSLLSGSRTDVAATYSVRVELWINSISRASEYPVFGRGSGTNTAEVVFVAPSGQKQFLTDAHNAWLNILGQSGIIGFIAFSLLCAYCWSISSFRGGSLDSDGVLLVAASCGFTGAFLYQNLFGSYEDARHLWVWMGFMAALHQRISLPNENAIARGATPRLLLARHAI